MLCKKLMCLFCLVQGIAISANAQFPFAAQPFNEKRDLSALMVEGIDRYLLQRTQEAKQKRSSHWKYDFTSPEQFSASVQANRELLAKRLGVVDVRAGSVMEIQSTAGLKQMLVSGTATNTYAVRWKVFDTWWAEGILIQPKKETKCRVVLLPDADIEPETMAGMGDKNLPGWASALRLANAGSEVLIPVLVSRQDDFSGSESLHHFTNQPHREWIYRQAYELGRHVVGYELQKIFAAIDWFQFANKYANRPALPIGVAGYGEGGLLALYAAALDRRISTTLVSGYFTERDNMWHEPIYRNVFGQLNIFGDAELAVMAWPSKLIIECSRGPIVSGPPIQTEARTGAAPGVLDSPPVLAAFNEFEKAKSVVPAAKNHLYWVQGKSGAESAPFSDSALALFANQLTLQKSKLPLPTASIKPGQWLDVRERQRRTVQSMEILVQHELLVCERTRDRDFWDQLKGDSLAQESIRAVQRKRLADVLGKVELPELPFNTKARLLEKTDRWTSYEISLDVLPDVFAWGILMIPNSMKPGEKRPVVVCQHGLEGLPFDAVTTDSSTEYYHFYKGFATQLADRGYITFSPHNPYRGHDTFRVLQRKANPIGLTLFSIIAAQHQRIFNWLAAQSFVDASRIGFYGLSYGGKTAMRVTPQVTGYALSICSGDFNEWVLKNATTNYDFSYLFTNEYEMPEWDLGHTFNYAEMAALIAPRPFMVERGIYDGVATDEWVDFEFAKVRHYYMELGMPEKCAIEHFAGPHTINGKATFDFLDKYLKKDWSTENKAVNK